MGLGGVVRVGDDIAPTIALVGSNGGEGGGAMCNRHREGGSGVSDGEGD